MGRKEKKEVSEMTKKIEAVGRTGCEAVCSEEEIIDQREAENSLPVGMPMVPAFMRIFTSNVAFLDCHVPHHGRQLWPSRNCTFRVLICKLSLST